LRHDTKELRHNFSWVPLKASSKETTIIGSARFESRPKVALLVESSRSYGRGLLRGIARYARTYTNWSLLHQEMTIDAQPPHWLTEIPVDGVIARVDAHNVDSIRRLKAPIVDVRCRRAFTGIPRVDTDDCQVAQLAFEHLYQRGFRRFAFCGFQYTHYSDARKKHFAQRVAETGCTLSVYDSPAQPGAPVTNTEEAGLVDNEALSQWLKGLVPPTGLFVCNDIRGQQLLNVCRSLGLVVPDDLAVIGVDDDDTICPLSDPPLSSVRPDVEQVGYRAAQRLEQMMLGGQVVEDVEYIPPVDVVQRLSTQAEAIEDRELSRVCRFIRQHACQGIDVHDVSEFSSLSRRQLERRFRELLGRSPKEEITAVQIGRVRQLLAETELTLEAISPLAGYTHKESLCAVFKRETGETPSEYRRRIAVES